MSGFIPLREHAELAYQAIAGELLQAVRGEAPCDCVIRNCRIVNVLSHEILTGDIWIKHGYIVHVDYGDSLAPGVPEVVPLAPLQADAELDAAGRFVLPGFADAHIHVESTMLTPAVLGGLLALKGTTAIFADPHEIVNVAGEDAFRYMIENSRISPMRQYFLVPSSVPAAPGLETAGADWQADTIAAMLDLGDDIQNRIAGLAEAMSYPGIIAGASRQADIMAAARSRRAFIQGHVFGAYKRDLATYILEGAESNHEAMGPADINRLLQYGVRVDVRLGSSLADSISTGLAEAAIKLDPDASMSETCTDDVHVTDIINHGHISNTVRSLLAAGDDPIAAIKRASLAVYQSYGIPRAGAIAPGFIADLQVLPEQFAALDDLDKIGQTPPALVMVDGRLVVEDGRLVGDGAWSPGAAGNAPGHAFEKRNTVQLQPLSIDDFRIDVGGRSGQVTVNAMNCQTLLVEPATIELQIEGGELLWKEHPAGLAACKVFNRYGLDQSGTGILVDFGFTGGALASTISHDSHNLTVVYTDEAAALTACQVLAECGGGISYVNPDGELFVLPLPVGGLMSAEPAEQVSSQLLAITAAYQRYNPGANIMGICILALPVAPFYRISDLGIIDVLTQSFVPLIAD